MARVICWEHLKWVNWNISAVCELYRRLATVISAEVSTKGLLRSLKLTIRPTRPTLSRAMQTTILDICFFSSNLPRWPNAHLFDVVLAAANQPRRRMTWMPWLDRDASSRMIARYFPLRFNFKCFAWHHEASSFWILLFWVIVFELSILALFSNASKTRILVVCDLEFSLKNCSSQKRAIWGEVSTE